MKNNIYNNNAYTLVGFLITLFLSSLVLGGATNLIVNNVQTSQSTIIRNQRFYETDRAVAYALGWLRQHSLEIVTPFTRANFYNNFKKVPSNGTAKGSTDGKFELYTKIRRASADGSLPTTQNVILSNNEEIGTSNFPATTHLKTGTAFDAISSFNSINFGNVMVRITLINAVARNPSIDYGDPVEKNPAGTLPNTDFSPIFRIDAMTSATHGLHAYSYATGTLYYDSSGSFSSSENSTMREECDAYDSSLGPYNLTTNRTANCLIASETKVLIRTGAVLYGSAESYLDVKNNGTMCAEIASPATCKKSPGCIGTACNVPTIAPLPDWDTVCNTTPYDVPGKTWIRKTSNNYDYPYVLQPGICYEHVHVGGNASAILYDTTTPYYIDELSFRWQTKNRLYIAPLNATHTAVDNNGSVQLHVYHKNGANYTGAMLMHLKSITAPVGKDIGDCLGIAPKARLPHPQCTYTVYNNVINQWEPSDGLRGETQQPRPTRLFIYHYGPQSISFFRRWPVFAVAFGPRSVSKAGAFGDMHFFGAFSGRHMNGKGHAFLHQDTSINESVPKDMRFTQRSVAPYYR